MLIHTHTHTHTHTVLTAAKKKISRHKHCLMRINIISNLVLTGTDAAIHCEHSKLLNFSIFDKVCF